MTSVVVDASLALKWVLREDLSREANAIFHAWTENNDELLVPDLFLFEVAHVLYRKQRSGPFSLEHSWLAFLSIRGRVTLRALTPLDTFRAFQIGNMTDRPDAYDAHYLALAEREECQYWTADERFWNATKGSFPRVRWLGETQEQEM